jgi:hypothetical protein
MAKLDFEKDRRRRLRPDLCPDSPWRNEESAPIVARFPSAPPEPELSKKRGRSRFVPRLPEVFESLRAIAQSLGRRGAFPYLTKAEKAEELGKVQRRLSRIVEREGSAVRRTKEYRLAESALSRALQSLKQKA